MNSVNIALIDNTGRERFDRTKEEKINEYAILYYNSSNTNERTRYLSNAATVFSNSRYVIANSGQFKKFYSVFGDEVISDLSLLFIKLFIRYNPHPNSTEELVPFYSYFRKIAALELSILFKRSDTNRTVSIYSGDDDDDDSEIQIEDASAFLGDLDDLIVFDLAVNLAYLSVKFEEHRSNEARVIAFRMFFTGTVINILKGYDEALNYFQNKKYERKIITACNPDFLDYVLVKSVRDFYGICFTDLKKYKDMLPLPNTAKPDKEVELPIRNFVYAAFSNTTKSNISQLKKPYDELVLTVLFE